jgi:predicted MPP superfamily phosphohydrolase
VLWLGRFLTKLVERLPAAVPAPVVATAAPVDRPTVTGPAILYPTRRQFLGAAAAFAPQAALGGTLLAAAGQAGKFRIRHIELALPQLPKGLDGMVLAHISDTHVGRFVGPKELEAIAQATAALNPDLIVFTGDLIDFNLVDLPPAIAALRQMETIAPVAMCVGNHDLFEDGRQFRRRVRTAEVGLMVNEAMPLTVRGQKVELLGLDWGTQFSPRADGLQQHMRDVLRRRHASGFPILLAHHPHAFDQAAEAGIPLTLSGHTHGGQIMLTPNWGPGRAFKYWSGLYARGDSKLVGNWFHLRINAPAEIIRLTLRTA